MKNESRRSKSAGASHPVWKFYSCHVNSLFRKLAICLLCGEAKYYKPAEVNIKDGSPTNLNTQLPRHKEAHREVNAAKAGKNNGAAPVMKSSDNEGSILRFLKPEIGDWNAALIRFIGMSNQPISIVENKHFQAMVHITKKGIKILTGRALLADMEAIRDDLQVSIAVAVMLKDQYVCMAADGWTSDANDTSVSLTVVSINGDWEVVKLVLNCAKSEGSTTGDRRAKKWRPY